MFQLFLARIVAEPLLVHLAILESMYFKIKKANFLDKMSSFSPLDFIGNIFDKQATLIGQPHLPCAHVSDRPIFDP